MGQTAALCVPNKAGNGNVTVHIYDVSTSITAELAGSTSYQVMLRVRDEEYGYSKAGIFSRFPWAHTELECKEAIRLGRTDASESEVEAILEDLSVSYTGSQFNTLTRNSGHFCNDLCLRLGVDPMPASFMYLAGEGASEENHVAKAQDLDAKARPGIASKRAVLSARAQALNAKFGVSVADARGSICKAKGAQGTEDTQGYPFADLTRGLMKMKAAWSARSASRQ